MICCGEIWFSRYRPATTRPSHGFWHTDSGSLLQTLPLKGQRRARNKRTGASDAQLLAFARVRPHVRGGEGAHPWVGGFLGLPVFAIRSTSRGALSGWCDCGYTPTVYTHGHHKKAPDSDDDETVAIVVARLPCVRKKPVVHI